MDAYAYVNHGRWVVECPVCGGGERVPTAEGSPTTILCQVPACGTELGVIFPEKRAQIESVLLLRENLVNRNWSPGETVADLEAENVEHGVVTI
jgi:hypothetical protein